MERFVVACIIIAFIVGTPANADAATKDTKLDAVASYVAGHPVHVNCQPITDPILSGGTLGYVYPHDLTNIYLGTYACGWLKDPTSPLFGGGLHVLAHEAAHTRGIVDEGEAECWALVWTMDLARRFYGVEFFTPQSRAIDLASQRIHELTPSQYRAAC